MLGFGQTASDTDNPLSAAIRHAVFVLLLCVAAVCAVSVVSMSKLGKQIGQWAQIENLDTQREQLETTVRQYLDGAESVTYDDVIAALGDLNAGATRLSEGDPGSQLAYASSEAINLAQTLFVAVHEKSQAAEDGYAKLQGRVRELRLASANWSNELRTRKGIAEASVAELEEYQLVVGARLQGLTDAMLVALRIQRQIDAADRLDPAIGGLAAVSVVLADAQHLPAPCPTGASSDDVCKPNTIRVRASLNDLQSATPETLRQSILNVTRALTGYMRSAETKYRTLSESLSESIEESNALRARLSDYDRLEQSLARNIRIFLELDTSTKDAMRGGFNVMIADQTIKSLVSNLRFRVTGFLNGASFVDADPSQIAQLVGTVERGWIQLKNDIIARDRFLTEFQNEMAALARRIEINAGLVRQETTRRVGIFVTVVLGAATGLAALGILGVRFVNLRLGAPLARVTGSLMDLANDKLDTPIDLKSEAFGFDRLGHALEMLRFAISERNALAERNAAQKAEIEANWHKLKDTTREMQWLAMHDPMTKLGNRRKADADLSNLTEHARATQRDFCIIHADVDRFKEINDSLGHEAGDFVLRHVSEILSEKVSDVGECYRIGGDEFLIVLQDIEPDFDTSTFASGIVADMACPVTYKGHACRTGASLGVAFGRDAGFDAAVTLINADLALYEAKNNGRNQFRFFEDELQAYHRSRTRKSEILLEAIESEEFTPVFQPQFYSDGLTLRGMETLCRWNSPVLGWVPPAKFLPLADELKVLGKIDRILFRRASRQISEMRENGVYIPRVSFNLTADRLLHTNLAEELTTQFPEDIQVAVELLESMSLDSLTDSVRWSIDGLKDKGIEIEIDDFGSCRASVAGLIAVGPDAMKIDSSIILPLISSPQHLQLVKAIIEIGRALNIEVIAEGVETVEHVDILSDMGCDVMQGFALARPMPLEELEPFLLQCQSDRNFLSDRLSFGT